MNSACHKCKHFICEEGIEYDEYDINYPQIHCGQGLYRVSITPWGEFYNELTQALSKGDDCKLFEELI